MSLKKGGGPKELPATLTLVGQGSTDKVNLVYHNRNQAEIRKLVTDGFRSAKLIPFIVKSWDAEYELTEEGVREFEDEYPGIQDAVLEAFAIARRKTLEKN